MGGTVYCLGNSETDLKDTLWAELEEKFDKFKTLVPGAVWSKGGSIICDPENGEKAKWKLRLRGTRKRTKEESSGSVQGRHGDYLLFFIDEMAKVDLSVITGIDNTCTDRRHNIICGAGNPDSQIDALHQWITLDYVTGIRISGYDHPNIVCGRRVIPGGAVTPESLAEREKHKDPNDPFVLSRTRGISPADSQNSLIKWPVFEAAENFNPDYVEFGNAVGIDVANSTKGDKAGLVRMKGQIYTYLNEFVCPNANAIVPNVLLQGEDLDKYLNYLPDGELRDIPLPFYDLPHFPDWLIEAHEIAVDVTGVGVGTSNEFIVYGWDVFSYIAGATVMNSEGLIQLVPTRPESSKPAYQIADVRTLSFLLFQWDLQAKRIGFGPEVEHDIVKQLHVEASAHSLTKNDRGIKLISKDEVRKSLMGGKSPNLLDAAMQANLIRRINNLGIVPEGEPGRENRNMSEYAGVDF